MIGNISAVTWLMKDTRIALSVPEMGAGLKSVVEKFSGSFNFLFTSVRIVGAAIRTIGFSAGSDVCIPVYYSAYCKSWELGGLTAYGLASRRGAF